MQMRAARKFGFCQILKRHVPRHRQIGTVDLYEEARRCDGFVLLAHGFGDRRDIVIVRRVESVWQETGDYAWRGSFEKGTEGFGNIDGGLHMGEIFLQRLPVMWRDRSDAGHPLKRRVPVSSVMRR